MSEAYEGQGLRQLGKLTHNDTLNLLQDVRRLRAEYLDAAIPAEIIASITADFIPIIGQVKGAYEANTGMNFFTQDTLSGFDRTLSIASSIGEFKTLAKLDDIFGAAKGLRKLEPAEDLGRAAVETLIMT